ncbi:uncharacterized protein RJT21DRAFT_11 [Scheffersomyces amazonensis]|uniref:uncharacterized protein n=1 Tax=Scheffersomyces amazonensis TaxID=1078765 RepID=UPI00315D94A7
MDSSTTTSSDYSSQQIMFNYANECDLEIHCSPFGLSGLYIRINGTNLMGIGSTMGLITGSTKGLIHYNDSNDFIDQKYKLYVIVDDEGMLRIDFTKIFKLQREGGSSNANASKTKKIKDQKDEDTNETSKKIDEDSNAASSSEKGDNSDRAQDDDVDLDKGVDGKESDEDKYEEEEVPTLIFRGKCPEGRPDHIEPFIGIFSFER